MTIITPTGITGITSITSTGNTLQFQNPSGADVSVSGLNVTSGTNINVTGIVTASGGFSGNINSTGVSTFRNIVGVSTIGVTTAYVTAINDGPISGARNRIINGDMRIDQRNGGASISLSGAPFPVDRFIARQGQSTSTGQRSAVAPVGFTSSLLYSVTTGASASTGGTGYITQYIEGNNMSDLSWGTSNAKPVTVSFWVRSSIVGTYGLSISNPSNTLGYTTSYSISSANTWEYKTITFPGSTTGTWAIDNTGFCYIIWDLGVGSSYSTSGGTWYSGISIGLTGGVKLSETTGATFNITGVQLEVGTVATPFERRSYGQELALCQRYYETITYGGNGMVSTGQAYSTTNAQAPFSWKVTKRGTPTISLSSGASPRAYNATGTANNATYTFNNITTDCCWIEVASSGLVAGNASLVYLATSGNSVIISSEL